MKRTLINIALFLVTVYSYAQTAGTLDNTFGTNGKIITSLTAYNDRLTDVLTQKDGKIIVVGHTFNFTSPFISPYVHLIRYNANGTLDNTFGVSGKTIVKSDTADYYGFAIALQSDDKIVVGGLTKQSLCVMRFNTNGTLDNSFDNDGLVILKIQGEISEAQAIIVQPDGKIVVAGTKSVFNNQYSKSFIARFNTDGSIDKSFNTVGYTDYSVNNSAIEGAYDIGMQSDGKILICGYSVISSASGYSYTSFLMRLNTNGTFDTTFAINGVATQPNSRATTLNVLNNGKILVAGLMFDSIKFNPTSINGIYRYNTNGSLDDSFGTNGIVKSNLASGAFDLKVQTDSKIILLSSDAVPNQVNQDLKLVRYNANGVVDTTFATKGVSTTNNTLGISEPRMILQTDSKIVVCGEIKENTKSNITVLRFNNTVSTSIKPVVTKEKISIFPNPFHKDLDIKFDVIDVDNLVVRVLDVLGNIVYQQEYDIIYQQQTVPLNLTNLPSGLYQIHFKSPKIFQVQSILKL